MESKLKHAKLYWGQTRGFVLLFTVVISSIILAMALGISNVNYKEQLLAIQARDSTISFFAADAGAECGLYWDRQTDIFIGVANGGTQFPIISCNETAMVGNGSADEGDGLVVYDFPLASAGLPIGEGCAPLKVTTNTEVGKDALGNPIIGTKIESFGYNAACDDISSTSSLRIVERSLKVQYPN